MPKKKPEKKLREHEPPEGKGTEAKEFQRNKRQSVTKPKRSHFTRVLCLDVRAYFFIFLGPKDQASLRAVSKDCRIEFNHAAQRGYVACMICEEYVEGVNKIYEDGEDGHPKLHFAPGDQKNFFAAKEADWFTYKMQRSGKDKNATLIVNVAKMLGKGETKLPDNFLRYAQFKAVHFIETQALEKIGHSCLDDAQKLVCFTMSTPCPKLKSVGNHWLNDCPALKKVSFTGCTALESVGDHWLSFCHVLESIAFEGCSALSIVGDYWLRDCLALQAADFSALVFLKSVGAYWLFQCSSLKIAEFSGCSALEEVGDVWMYDCKSLEEVRLGASVSLKSIGEESLDDCPSLRRVVLPSDTELPDDIVRRVKEYLE